MPAGSLLALLDDIASVLDDVAILTKVAAKKTAGVLGDDLALNAQQVTGVQRRPRAAGGVGGGQGLAGQQGDPGAGGAGDQRVRAVAGHAAADARRRLPVLRGLREAGAQAPARRRRDAAHREALAQALADPTVDLVALEKDKIKGAVRTDFILSAEIIAITLGTVATQPFGTQVAVLVGIALVMTVGRLRPGGRHRQARRRRAAGSAGRPTAVRQALRALGRGILAVAPWLMKVLSVAGTAAMFLVGGGILTHGMPFLHHHAEAFVAWLGALPGVASALSALGPTLFDLVVGFVAGTIIVAVVSVVRCLVRSRGDAAAG